MRLEVRNLTKVYDGGWGAHEVSFSVPPGQIVALGGPNGSGKSTVLKCIAGLARFEGAVLVDGGLVGPDPASRTAMGYLPQTVGMPAHATIGEMLQLFADLRGADVSTIPLPDAFLRDHTTQLGALSGGQRHRVALAIAMLGEPSLLLLDEPVANLDDEGRSTFWRVLRELRDTRGTSAIVSSPAPGELREVADRGISMHDGRITADESFAGLRVAPEPGSDEEASA
jgi:ABC-type multidrug transport system ATPase subunit